MIQRKKLTVFTCCLCLIVLSAVGCGRNMDVDHSSGDSSGSSAVSQTGIDTGQTVERENPDDERSDEESNLGAAGDMAEDAAEGAANAIDEAKDTADDLIEDAGDAADRVADGAGDAVDNLGGGPFDNYKEARKYLLNKLGKDNSSAHYELREEKEDLVSYNTNDADALGYEFLVYETDGNERIGKYYVDKKTGKIYRYMGKNSIEAY